MLMEPRKIKGVKGTLSLGSLPLWGSEEVTLLFSKIMN